jgi:hypothetical protein
LLGVGISEKSWTYLLAAQLCFSEGISSIIPAIAALSIGYAYLGDSLKLQDYRLPNIVRVENFIPCSIKIN